MTTNRFLTMSKEEIKRVETLQMAEEKRITQKKEQNELESLHGTLDGYYDGTESKGRKGSSRGIEGNPAITACQRRKEKRL